MEKTRRVNEQLERLRNLEKDIADPFTRNEAMADLDSWYERIKDTKGDDSMHYRPISKINYIRDFIKNPIVELKQPVEPEETHEARFNRLGREADDREFTYRNQYLKENKPGMFEKVKGCVGRFCKTNKGGKKNRNKSRKRKYRK